MDKMHYRWMRCRNIVIFSTNYIIVQVSSYIKPFFRNGGYLIKILISKGNPIY